MSGYTAATMAVISIATSVYGSIEASKQQKANAEYQNAVAENNAQIAENNAKVAFEQGRSEAKTGYENKLLKRQEVAQVIGRQRAQQGASGAQVDTGSLLDFNLDTMEIGERDALKMEQAGYDAQYQYDVQGYNYLNQTASYDAQSSALQDKSNSINPWLSAGTTLIGSVSSNYSSFDSMTKKPSTTGTTGTTGSGTSMNLFSGTKWV